MPASHAAPRNFHQYRASAMQFSIIKQPTECLTSSTGFKTLSSELPWEVVPQRSSRIQIDHAGAGSSGKYCQSAVYDAGSRVKVAASSWGPHGILTFESCATYRESESESILRASSSNTDINLQRASNRTHVSYS